MLRPGGTSPAPAAAETLVVLVANEEARLGFVVHDLCHALVVAELDARHVRWPERSVGSRDARECHTTLSRVSH